MMDDLNKPPPPISRHLRRAELKTNSSHVDTTINLQSLNVNQQHSPYFGIETRREHSSQTYYKDFIHLVAISRAKTWSDTDIPQWIATKKTQGLLEIGKRITIEEQRDGVTLHATITRVKAMEKEWITFYAVGGPRNIMEISAPYNWTLLPPHKRLEYTVLYDTLTDVLQTIYPPAGRHGGT